jgi:hypothetical protein
MQDDDEKIAMMFSRLLVLYSPVYSIVMRSRTAQGRYCIWVIQKIRVVVHTVHVPE